MLQAFLMPFSNQNARTDFEIEALSRSMAVIRFNPDGTIIEANDNFLNAMGYTLDEIKGQHHAMFVDMVEKQSPEYRTFWNNLREGIFSARQFKRVAKGGREVWIEATYNPIMDTKGRVMYVVKYATDVTAKKLQEADYAGQLAAIGKSQAVIEFNLDGKIITANTNFTSAMGYSLAEIQGKHHSMFVDPEYARTPEYQMFWSRLAEGEFFAGEFKRVNKAGQDVWIQASYNPILDMNGKPFKVVKYATDITDSKLRTADYAGQIEAIGKAQAVIEFKLDGTILSANENFLNAVGYSMDEIRGEHHRMFVAPEESATPEYARFWENLAAGKFDARVYRRIKKNGQDIWIQASYNPIFDMNGKPFKVVKYATDVTSVIEVGQVADQTSANTQSVAAAVEEMSASVDEITKSMAMTSSSTSDISAVIVEASAAAEQLIGNARAMEGIIRVIEEIAGQTNLLALNATIEAARAGEAGKGFAVVANEVKLLAGQTAKATEDVTREIKNVQSASEALLINISEVSKAVNTVNNHVSGVAGAIEEQSAVTKEISSNTNKIAYSIDDISARIKRIC